MEWMGRLRSCAASFVTQNHYAEIHIFNLFIYMRGKRKQGRYLATSNIKTQMEQGVI
jgi:hypothetical protein